MAGKRKKKRQRVPSDFLDNNNAAAVVEQWTDSETFTNTPFADLKKRLKQSASHAPLAKEKKSGHCHTPREKSKPETSTVKVLPPGEPSESKEPAQSPSPTATATDDEAALFLQAMEGVRPVKWGKGTVDVIPRDTPGPALQAKDEEDACRKELENIVKGKSQIPVEHTPEYAEGPQINSNPRIVRKLRRGKFSIQAYCDLHGLTSKEAIEWCDEFMKHSLVADRSCIAFIHGRGLSSPKGPVLKKMVHEWLTKGKWRRHIIAYSSAPSWDGGPGVTYVLLRQKPIPRKRRKKRKLW